MSYSKALKNKGCILAIIFDIGICFILIHYLIDVKDAVLLRALDSFCVTLQSTVSQEKI